MNTKTTPSRSIRDVLSWVDPYLGPLLGVETRSLRLPDPLWWLTNCRHVSNVSGGQDPRAVGPVTASGISIDPGRSLESALGEAVERYSAFNSAHVTERTFRAPPDPDLVGRFPTCHAEERAHPGYLPVNPGDPLTLARVESLSDATPRWIPAPHVDLAFAPAPAERPVAIPVSTGFAFAPTPIAATWAGLCEVAERDALMVNWWCRLRPPAIALDLAHASDRLASQVERIARVGLRLSLYDFTLDFPAPTIVAALRSDHYPYFTVGSSCKSDPLAACCKAIDEAVSARLLARQPLSTPNPSLHSFEWVNDFADHVHLYANGQLLGQVPFLTPPSPPSIGLAELVGQYRMPAPSDSNELRRIARALGHLGLTVLRVDVTAPELRGIGSVFKVTVPEMVPLSGTHAARWLGTPRLKRFLGKASPRLADFERLPHPFA